MNPRRVTSRRSSMGVARIQRDFYSNTKQSWWTINAAVRKRDGGKCVFCGDKADDVHHVTSLSRGGTTSMSNLVSVCEDCHAARHPHLRTQRKRA